MRWLWKWTIVLQLTWSTGSCWSHVVPNHVKLKPGDFCVFCVCDFWFLCLQRWWNEFTWTNLSVKGTWQVSSNCILLNKKNNACWVFRTRSSVSPHSAAFSSSLLSQQFFLITSAEPNSFCNGSVSSVSPSPRMSPLTLKPNSSTFLSLCLWAQTRFNLIWQQLVGCSWLLWESRGIWEVVYHVSSRFLFY